MKSKISVTRGVEILAVVLVALFAVGWAGRFALELSYRALVEDAGWSPVSLASLRIAFTYVPPFLVHVAISVWLWRSARADHRPAIIWVPVGLAFGLLAVILYLLVNTGGNTCVTPSTDECQSH